MNCPNCGKELRENQKFCSSCGTKLKIEETNKNNESSSNNILHWGIITGLVVFVIVLIVLLFVAQKSTYNSAYNNPSKNNTSQIQKTEEPKEVEPPKVPRKCIYETRNGSCFTTKIFEVEPTVYTGTQHDNWLMAKNTCENLGYKLPNEADLTSLASDILGGINVKSGIDSETYEDNDVGLNPNPLNKLGTQCSNDYYYFNLWENSAFNENKAYHRILTTGFMGAQTHRGISDRKSYSSTYVLCVYDPYGKPKKNSPKTTPNNQPQKVDKQQGQKTESQQINSTTNSSVQTSSATTKPTPKKAAPKPIPKPNMNVDDAMDMFNE